MTTWWDDNQQRYRSTLPHKIFHVWTWPLMRFVLFRCLNPEQAHWFAAHIAIRFVHAVDRAWQLVVLIFVVTILLLVRALLLLPWFACDPPEGDAKQREVG